ncbi:hypothetical protein F8S13_19665 [Chloroflexia bacterium SDU3-3]|nr:hypothetical protein F8S13_19665 [Chloroflexia bacterium SDU3-3]
MSVSVKTLANVERVVGLLRDNPGCALTVREVAESIGLNADEARAYLDDLAAHRLAIKEVAANGVGRYLFASAYQRAARSYER